MEYLFDAGLAGAVIYLIWCVWEASETDQTRWTTQQQINTRLIDVTQSLAKSVHQYDILREARSRNLNI